MIGLACSLAVSIGLAAGSPPLAGDRHLAVSVQVLEASNAQPTVAPQSRAARDLAATLNYKSYRTLREEKRTLGFAEHMTFALPNGARVELVPVSVEPGQRSVRLRVAIAQGGHKLSTEYSVRNGGTVFVSAGPSANNGVFVLAIVPKLN